MKKIVALLLAAIILCAFVGCSSKEASVEEQKEALANEETTEEDTSAEEPLTIAFCQIGNYNTWRIAARVIRQSRFPMCKILLHRSQTIFCCRPARQLGLRRCYPWPLMLEFLFC